MKIQRKALSAVTASEVTLAAHDQMQTERLGDILCTVGFI